jgi:hypothetical protein
MYVRVFLRFSLLAAVLLAASSAGAQGDARKAEARAHFERAMRAFNGGDNALALAEFRRADELVPHLLVKYNVALVLAAAGRSVEAVELSEALLREPSGLSGEQRARLEATRSEQAQRVALLTIQTPLREGVVEVDGVQAATLPLGSPLRVVAGSRIVGVVAPGHAPLRREVIVAGGATAVVALDPPPLQGRLAQLRVATRTLAAEVFVDGQLVGRSPLPASLPVVPGVHAVELRRRGYLSARREVSLGEGAVGEVSVDLDEDPSAFTGQLLLLIRHPDAQVFLDDRLRSGWGLGLALPPGPHRLRVERGGYRTHEGQVDLPEGVPLRLAIHLDPSAETLAAETERAKTWRKVAWGGMIGGAALALGGGGYLFYASRKQDEAQRDLEAFLGTQTPQNQATGGPLCVIGSTPVRSGDLCREHDQALSDRVDSWRSRKIPGYIGLGLGVAALAAGVILYTTGDDPERRQDQGPLPYGRWPGVRWRLAAGPGGATLQGSFLLLFCGRVVWVRDHGGTRYEGRGR